MASSESLTSPLDMSPSEEEPSPKRNKYSFPVNSLETMQRNVMNAFALKYSKCEHIVACIPYLKPSLNIKSLYYTVHAYRITEVFPEIHCSQTFWK